MQAVVIRIDAGCSLQILLHLVHRIFVVILAAVSHEVEISLSRAQLISDIARISMGCALIGSGGALLISS